MSRVNPEQGLLPSVLDRLIDPESAGTAWRHGYGVEQMEAAVRRDLEELLNTRQTFTRPPDEFPETAASIAAYGLPDLTSFNAITPQQREAIGRTIEAIIARFEPRLRDVRAALADAGDDKTRRVRFRVEARLCLEPAPEVAFDTILELTTGHCSVKPPEP
jgi:type VI secretion system protein ImpF